MTTRLLVGQNQKPCPDCGKPMHRQSRICRACYTAAKARPESYQDRTCRVCAAGFRVHVSQINRGQGRYCSQTCARSGSPARKRHPRPVVTCAQCSKSFEKHPTEVKRNRRGLHFCSPQCWHDYNSGERNYWWSGGLHKRMRRELRLWRRDVIKRDQRRCRLCHSSQNLEAHHIKPLRSHPELAADVANGITLCRDDHRQLAGKEHEMECELSVLAGVRLHVVEGEATEAKLRRVLFNIGLAMEAEA